MQRRTRTAKKLAQRIALDYFKGPHWFRTWRIRLLIGVPLVFIPFILAPAVRTNHGVYSPGRLSTAHTLLNSRCDACHTKIAGRFHRAPLDAACISCHDGPTHNANVVANPQCAVCHFEHQGRTTLSAQTDKGCTDCHAALKTRNGRPSFLNVSGFASGKHPEFAVKRLGAVDPGTIKYSHATHADLKHCTFCHATAIPGTPAASLDAAGTRRPTALSGGAYMAKVRFTDHCLSCHRDKMVFERKVLRQVPHDTPQVIHDAIIKQPNVGTVDVPALEAKLWKKCEYCHTMQYSTAGLPTVAPSAVPDRWFKHALFSHDAHRAFACEGCHVRASASKSEHDVLVPGIGTCQSCHRTGAVASDCAECHSYHNWTTEKRMTALMDPSCLQSGRPIDTCRISMQEKSAETSR